VEKAEGEGDSICHALANPSKQYGNNKTKTIPTWPGLFFIYIETMF